MLLRQQIKVYTGQKNLIYRTFNTEQVMRWRLIFEEYNPELIYIQGSKNIAAEVLSRLDIVDALNPVKNNIISLNEYYWLEVEVILHPTNYKTIMLINRKTKN